MTIHVENAFKALHCQMCEKYLKKQQSITEQLKKKEKKERKQKVQSQRYQVFRQFLQNPKLPRNIMGFNNHN